MQFILSKLAKAAMAIGVELLAEKFLEEIMIWTAEKLAAHTKTKVDDELVAKIKDHLDY